MVLFAAVRKSHIFRPACSPALTLSVPMKPSDAVVTAVSTVMTLIPAARARSMAELRADDELGAMTMPATPREIEFSTSCTCSSMLVSDVGPKVLTDKPKSPPACFEPASITCQKDESLALMITSIFLPPAAPPRAASTAAAVRRRRWPVPPPPPGPPRPGRWPPPGRARTRYGSWPWRRGSSQPAVGACCPAPASFRGCGPKGRGDLSREASAWSSPRAGRGGRPGRRPWCRSAPGRRRGRCRGRPRRCRRRGGGAGRRRRCRGW